MRILALPKYGPMGASSRLRFLQYFPALKVSGLLLEQQNLLNDEALQLRYQAGRYTIWQLLKSYILRIQSIKSKGSFDVLWIEKEAMPWVPLWMELALLRGTPYVLDYDDAVFHNYDKHRLKWVRKLYGRRLDGLMAKATLVICGNDYLAQRARDAQATWVEVLPTVIDLERYALEPSHKAQSSDGLPRIVWIGSPSTVRYLELLREPLQELAQRLLFVLRIVGGKMDIPGVKVEFVDWTEATEVFSIASADIGIMPLLSSAWERGKCGYKLIQYMACGLPVVASPVGVNTEIVSDGENGFLVENKKAWINALEILILQPEIRAKMGQIGRQRVEREYCLQVVAPKLTNLLIKAANTA